MPLTVVVMLLPGQARCCWHRFVQGGTGPHTPGVPPPPHPSFAGHVSPQSSCPPQPSPAGPQLYPSAAQVVGTQVCVVVLHVSPVGQEAPHALQLFGSVSSSTHAPLHSV